MTQVNNLTAKATNIARELDKRDGNQDNKITASIWNQYVADKGGNTIKHSISLENAIKSITVYAQRGANVELTNTSNVNNTNNTNGTTKATKQSASSGESYNQYKKRAEAENAEKVIEKHKGEALRWIAMTKGDDYVPTEQELCDQIAKNLLFTVRQFTKRDPADEFNNTVIAIYQPDRPPKSLAESYREAREAASKAIRDLESIMPKLSEEMQTEAKELIDKFNEKTSGTSGSRIWRLIDERNKNNTDEPKENPNNSNTKNSGLLGWLRKIFN